MELPISGELRNRLQRLFADAGYECPKLLAAIEAVEAVEGAESQDIQAKDRSTEQLVQQLMAENERLKQEISRLRNLIFDRASNSMSSKLKDALRE